MDLLISPMHSILTLAAAPTQLAASLGVGIALVLLLSVVTCFAKLVMIAGAVSYGLGAPRLPSAGLAAAFALLLTCVIMWPVWDRCSAAYARAGENQQAAWAAASEPLESFLRVNSNERSLTFFESTRAQIAAKSKVADATPAPVQRALTVAGPAFMLTEFTEAFMSVLLILLPFLVIDLVVTNLLVALGATSLPPATVALPLKVLAFVLMDGWKLIVQGVVLGYAYGS